MGTLVSGLLGSQLWGQNSGLDYSPTLPRSPFSNPAPVKYNLKYGDLSARLSGSVVSEYNDNINLSAHEARGDFSFGPRLGIGFLWPITRENVLHLDVDVGYIWYVHNSILDSFTLAPQSRLEHTIYFEKVRFNFHDKIAIQTDPVAQPQISGGTQPVVPFRRLDNDAGVDADWRPYRDLSLLAGYDFTLDRSLNSYFQSLDHNEHNFHAGVNYLLSPQVTVGLFGAYTIDEYLEDIQNNGTSYTVGPSLSLKLTRLITVTASGGYTASRFEHTGTLADFSNFNGITYQFAIHQALNSRMSHDVRVSRYAMLGYGSNFADTLALQYDWTGRLTRAINLQTSFAYETFQASGPVGERADQYLFRIGANCALSRRWNTGLAYSFAWKTSNFSANDYAQNRVTLTVTRQF